jgi:phosphoglycolate phosphatase-like HAD superfamily hydrolase
MNSEKSAGLMPPEAIIFDFDGVILDSADIKLRAYTTVYSGEDFEKLKTLVEHAQHHGGVTRRTKFAYYERELFGRSGDADSVNVLCRRYAEVVFGAVLKCPFVEGAQQLLECANGKIAMHVVSGTPNDELHQILQERGLAHFFRTIQGAPAIKRDAFDLIARSERCERRRVLAIGDSMTEYEAANDIGISFLGIVPTGVGNPFPQEVLIMPTLRDFKKVLQIK